jgi:hypothetical protein
MNRRCFSATRKPGLQRIILEKNSVSFPKKTKKK